MTKAQKIEWLKKATNHDLLIQYTQSATRADNAFEIVTKRNDITLDEIWEDYELTKNEVLRRMAQ